MYMHHTSNSMEFHFASRMKEYEKGVFQVLNEKKEELIGRGRKIYNLSVGTPDFKPSEKAMAALTEAAKNPDNYRYALTDLPELKEAVIDRFQRRYGVLLKQEEIMSVYGSQEGIAHIGLALCNPDDVVLIPDPGYPIFSVGPSLAGAEIVTYQLSADNNWLPDLNSISEEVCRRTKFIIVSYPLNPICKTAPYSFYEELVEWAQKHNIIVIHDNAYSDIIYDGEEGISFLSVPGAKEVGAEFYSLSKSFNLTGARIAFLVGNEKIVKVFQKLRSQIDYGIFLPVQYAAIEVLRGDDEGVLEQKAEYQKRRDALCGGLRKLGFRVPDSEGTMFVWAPLPKGFHNSEDFVMQLMEKAGVLCTPGSSFGKMGEGFVRFALILPVEQIVEMLQEIERSGILPIKEKQHFY